MLTELKFVMGAVAKKDFLPALTHFVIEKGTVRGYNGTLALCTPIPLDISCKPKADPLVRAIANCEDTVVLALTDAGRLSIKSGKFKVFVDCVEGETPHVMPSGETIAIDGEALLKAVKVLYPFIGSDASRPWSNGVLLCGQSAFATNNIMVIEYWIGSGLPHTINVPRAAIKEMIRINEAPTHAQLSESDITFHYTGDRWLRTQLFATDWPDIHKLIVACGEVMKPPRPVNADLFTALDSVKPFTDKFGRIIFTGSGIATHGDKEGAGHEVEGFDAVGVYQIEMLALLKGVAQTIDWSAYPAPCAFFGDRVRGLIVGMKQ
jgi:hypothetical protein